MNLEEVRKQYRDREDEIQDRLEDFRELRDAGDQRLFRELAFVIMSSRSEAENAWDAAVRMDRSGHLFKSGREEIERVLAEHEIQYEREKAGYIVENREKLSQPTLEDPSGDLKLKDRVNPDRLDSSRDWFQENVKGIGMKGASHFLRNIGYGDRFAIVSGYIAKKLYELDMKDSPEPPADRGEYMECEESVRRVAEKTGIDVKALDLVLWSMETGEVFR